MGSLIRAVFPPKPKFTEETVPDQRNRVFIVTGASGGIGKELAGILYSKNATVYVAARDETKSTAAIADLRARHPSSSGKLVYLLLDLADLSSVKRAAEKFLEHESRLDVLFNNAGVMIPPQGSQTAQGYELQLGTNCVGPFLFTRCLGRMLAATAKEEPRRDAVRVIWVSSGAVALAPSPPIDFQNMDYRNDEAIWVKYRRSKCGNVLHAAEFARRSAVDGVIHMSLDPGILKTDIVRTMSKRAWAVIKLVARDAKFGAYTQLFAGLSPEITAEQSGGYVAPFGRLEDCRADLMEEQLGKKFWEWSEEQIKPYL
ncbi:short-chain dehydrogenase [Thozetella sp. PMI_491]|nr:short-chain dehydrogenase [Thozetella sp. PMI_491]